MAFDSSKVADLVERVGASIVRIDAGHRFSGSGTVWGDDGIVVTAHHVIEREEGIELGTAGGSVKATLVGSDPGHGPRRLACGREAVARDAPRHRQAQGRRLRRRRRASRKDRARHVRHRLDAGRFVPDAHGRARGALSRARSRPPPGYSGGPLTDLDGNVVGINNRGVLRRVHLALPRETVDRVVGEILSHGRVRKGYLGVGVHPVKLPDAVAKAAGQDHGVLVHGIEPGSNADKAGVLQGDVLLSLDGQPISSPWQLATVLGGKVDTEVILRVARAGASPRSSRGPDECALIARTLGRARTFL